MPTENLLRSIAPAELVPARAIAHRAVQHLTKAARANLAAQPDDSHSNLGWDRGQQAFLTQPINGKFVGLSLSPLTLLLLDGAQATAILALDNKTDAEIGSWLDKCLTEAGLKTAADISLPYALPGDVVAIDQYKNTENDDRLAALAAWFSAAENTLTRFVDANKHINPGPSPVRCWPHHFDIATYVSFETGDPETARGIGIGLSPGDEGYNEPYLYINPWPHLNKDALPDAVTPGHWHTEGYVGLIATASELSACNNIAEAISEFVTNAFDVASKAQGL